MCHDHVYPFIFGQGNATSYILAPFSTVTDSHNGLLKCANMSGAYIFIIAIYSV